MTNDGEFFELDHFKKALNWKTFENLFCLGFYKKIMIDPFYLVTVFENICKYCLRLSFRK